MCKYEVLRQAVGLGASVVPARSPVHPADHDFEVSL